jgi:hypothetical protein
MPPSGHRSLRHVEPSAGEVGRDHLVVTIVGPSDRRDVVGVYLNPPDNAVVLCVWMRKSQVQAPGRTQPMLPVCSGLAAPAQHDDSTTARPHYFAALEAATANVVDACYSQHRHQEFGKFPTRVAK